MCPNPLATGSNLWGRGSPLPLGRLVPRGRPLPRGWFINYSLRLCEPRNGGSRRDYAKKEPGGKSGSAAVRNSCGFSGPEASKGQKKLFSATSTRRPNFGSVRRMLKCAGARHVSPALRLTSAGTPKLLYRVTRGLSFSWLSVAQMNTATCYREGQ